jgi:glycerol-3-phosphate dehydrogenase (NAD(P)+)
MLRNAAIIGDGAMGTVCAMLLAGNGVRVRLWGRNAQRTRQINVERQNRQYLPDCVLSEHIEAGTDPRWAFEQAEVAVSAVPSQFIRGVWGAFSAEVPERIPIISTAKGIENDTLLRPTEILAELCGRRIYAMLSGPSIAHEIASGLPCSVVIACADEATAKSTQATFNTSTFRVYTNTDLVGVELASAMKNIIAIAAGIIDGLKLGDNAKAALLSRGLVEITRLGVAMGAKAETFYGLAGVGALVTTCISPSGRNRTAGQRIGQGKSPSEVIRSTPSIIEGIPTTQSVVALARRHKVRLPIVEAVGEVLFEGLAPAEAVQSLMTREPRAE